MKNRIHKRIIAIITVIMLLAAVCIKAEPAASNTVTMGKNQTVANGFETVLQNDGYILSFNSSTADVAIIDKKTGEPLYTTPINAENDAVASGDNVGLLKSQVAVYYYEEQSLLSMNSFSDCIEQQGIEYTVRNNTLFVTYNLGDTSFSADILPRVLSKDRMEKKVLSKLDDDEAESILKRYTLYSRDELDVEALKSIRLNFPGIEKNDLYIRGTLPDYIAEGIWELFEKAGYTTADLQRDCDENGIENPYEEKVNFKITLEYTLNDDGFSVVVNPEKIKYLEEYKPCRIEVLPFFGAADVSHSGYMFVPDGSGSVINFNNGKTSVDAYFKKFFNDDGAITKTDNLSEAQKAVLPVFALSADDYGFLATIDQGYEVAGISADVSGKFNSYNYAYPFFDLVSVDNVSLSSQKADSFLLTSEELISSKIKVSYHLTDGGVNYSELAVLYRGILKESGILPQKAVSDSAELNIDFITSAIVTKRFLGIPYETITSLTTYEQANKILNKIPDISADVTLVNALSGGINQSTNKRIKFLSCLGSEKERYRLQSSANRLSVSYYAQRSENIKNSDRTKALNRSNKNVYLYNIVSRYFQKANAMELLSPAKLNAYADSINKSIKANDLKAVNVLDLGYELNSDFNIKNQYDRNEVRKQIENYLKKVSEKTEVTVDTGSYFSLKYISKIKNIPTTHSGYKITDYAVPFYQMVISGIIPYTTRSINQSDNIETAFLKTVELGAQLQCTWIYENAKNITNSREKYYGVLYKDSIDIISEYSKRYAPVYDKIAGNSISEHVWCSETLVKTSYENGISVYVNYGETPAEIDGITVNARDFYVKDGGNSAD